tara:strand:- start:151 stop:1272 length:1122 start_codon:yes stop_codon:yes gene_type:complete
MKISKRDLKRLILENMFEADSTVVATGANKSKAGDTAADASVVRNDIKAAVKKVVDKIVGPGALNITINIGKTMLTLRKAPGIDPDTKKEIRQALKDDAGLTAQRKNLKVLRAVKVNYDKEADEEAVLAAEDVKDVEQKQQDPEGIYSYDNDGYEYKVDSQSGCWFARKKSGGKWFSMRKYPDNMKKLDDRYPDARTTEQKAKCSAGKGKPSAPKKKKPQSPSSTSSPKQIMDTIFTLAEIKYAPTAGGTKASIYTGTLSDVGDLADLLDADITGPLADGIKNNPEYGIYMYYLEDSKEAVMVDTERFKKDGALVYIPIKQGFKPKMHKLGKPASYSPISDPAAFIEALTANKKDIAESLSHGSLIRNRYRRY